LYREIPEGRNYDAKAVFLLRINRCASTLSPTAARRQADQYQTQDAPRIVETEYEEKLTQAIARHEEQQKQLQKLTVLSGKREGRPTL
jgi:hypothetical protein